jgi:D-glycero-alpha-D-manno-heptose-7-phosphate kinase
MASAALVEIRSLTEIRAKAPLRISFCGGGTDVPPFPEERGGAVLSATIDKYAYGSLAPGAGPDTTVRSHDYDVFARLSTDGPTVYDGKLDLVKAAFKHFGPGRPVDLTLHSDAPPGSGLGSSSTMCVALVGLFTEFQKLPLTEYDIARKAYQLERVELGIHGGLQDQYAATFGGFNFIEFGKNDQVTVNPLRIKHETLNELHYRALLCFTGRTRLSANILREQTAAYMDRDEAVVRSLENMKEITLEMKGALLRGQLDLFGELLHEAWEHKRLLASQITNPGIDKLYAIARDNGAVGGKILGAGGGGYLLALVEPGARHACARALTGAGGQIVPFDFEERGLQTWTSSRGGRDAD